MSIELWQRFRHLVGQAFTLGAGKNLHRYRQLEFEFCIQNEGLMKEKKWRKTMCPNPAVTISSNVRKPLDK